ncbi:PREDICTED: E3 ubiquitin-protein ligase Topors-like [Pseudopodoces humilis]|uniref:E3 ubiquitin-protein ligase Topors-like n=1 Tax=Pseudopodoces humilis TaxID=181119 RepID=UPI0006B74A04|nr:PREDICTED: E3 ubiquitin-protein ligase Topors-like [Pseudopodoces humilis]
MATERDSNCPICQDSWKDVASALPCHHQFCLGCILRWTHRNPSCPLCRTPIETIRFSEQDEWDYVELVITSPAASPEAHSMAGRTPNHVEETSMHGPEVSPPSSPQGTLSPDEQGPAGPERVGGLLPEEWAGLFQQNQHLLEPVRPWLCERLERICRGWWWLVEAAESCILRYLCSCGLDTEALAQRLLVSLEGHTAPLIHGLIEVVAAQCSEEAQRLLHSHTAGDEDTSQAESTSSSRSKSSSFSSSSSQESTPTSGSNVEEETGTSEVTYHGVPSHPPPVRNPTERDQPQKEPEQPAVAGHSSQGSSCSPSAPSRAGTDG